MIFWQLFYTFLLIGIFTFGGGYSMVALIQDEVVRHHAWLTAGQFADLLAVSQTTPGPIGINAATYVGYTAVLSAGYPAWMAVGGAVVATVAVLLLPVSLALLVGVWTSRHAQNPYVASTMRMLALVVPGLVAAAALGMLTADNFGTPADGVQFALSVGVFVVVFVLSVWKKTSPLLLMAAAALFGLLVF